jgi:hypothetical protein
MLGNNYLFSLQTIYPNYLRKKKNLHFFPPVYKYLKVFFFNLKRQIFHNFFFILMNYMQLVIQNIFPEFKFHIIKLNFLIAMQM